MSDEAESEFQRWSTTHFEGVDMGTHKLREAFVAGYHAGAVATAAWPSDEREEKVEK